MLPCKKIENFRREKKRKKAYKRSRVKIGEWEE